MTVTDIKQRVAALRSSVATHTARLEQAELAVQKQEKQILDTYGLRPDQLEGALRQAEEEVQRTGQAILDRLQAAGA